MNTNIRYLIKVTSTACSNNPNFAGQVHTAYYGKDQKFITCYAHINPEPMKEDILRYGYKVTPPKKVLDFWNITLNTPIGNNPCYWEHKAEVVKIDFPEDTTPNINRPSTNTYNLKARLFHRKYNNIVNTPTYENSSNDRRVAYNLYSIYLRDCAQLEAATSSPTTLPPIITSPSIRCAVNEMLDKTDAELESIVSRMENLSYNHETHSWEAAK